MVQCYFESHAIIVKNNKDIDVYPDNLKVTKYVSKCIFVRIFDAFC